MNQMAQRTASTLIFTGMDRKLIRQSIVNFLWDCRVVIVTSIVRAPELTKEARLLIFAYS